MKTPKITKMYHVIQCKQTSNDTDNEIHVSQKLIWVGTPTFLCRQKSLNSGLAAQKEVFQNFGTNPSNLFSLV